MIYGNALYFIAILIVYLIIFLLIPSYVMYPVVKEKSFGYRIFTYIIASHFYVINVVYLLGYAHLFYLVTVLLLVIIIPVIIRTYMYRNMIKVYWAQLREYYIGNYNIRLMLRRDFTKIKESLIKRYGNLLKKNPLEIFVFCILFFAVIIFYGYYKFHFNSYGVSDEEVHLYWVQSLIGGDFFVSGMYPFGMHSAIVTVSVLTSINATFVSQMFSVIIMAQIVTCLYIFLRKFFKFKFGILFAIFFWLLADFGGVYTYFRYQYTLPMEYGLIFVFAAAYFMLSYIEDKKKNSLWMFGFAVSLTFSTHFYLTGFAVVICVFMGITCIWRIIRKKLIHWLIGMAILGIVMSAVPFGVGYLLGYPFEQSIEWALGVMEPTDTSTTGDGTQTDKILSLKNPNDIYQGFSTALKDMGEISQKQANFLFISDGALIIFGILGIIFSKNRLRYSFFIGIGFSWAIILLLSAAASFGISEYVESKRAIEWVFILNVTLISGFFEIIFKLISLIFRREDFSRLVMIYALACLLYFVISVNYLKTQRVSAIIQTEQLATFCEEVNQNYEKHTWTLVSTVNERSMIINSGFHYEMIDLLEELEGYADNQKIYIPTKYVFFSIEKKPIAYNTVADVLVKKDTVGNTKVSREFAKETIDFSVSRKTRSQLYDNQREAIMSKTYYWAKEYEKLFPHEMKVYYEDDEIIIYRLEQDTYALNNLSINYGYN